MTIQITLHIFSGRPDPIWALSQNDEETLIKLLESSENLDTAPSRGLGYRGFSVLRTDISQGGEAMLFNNAQSDDIGGSFVAGQPEIEEFLLWTAEDNLDDELSHYVREMILSEPEIDLSLHTKGSTSCPPSGGLNAPSYNPGFWNNNVARRRQNNCYNYANNQATNTYAQPGKGSGSKYSSTNCSDVGSASIRDGLRRVSTYQASTAGWYTALVIWPGRDYHWYRQDSNGCWSHKRGQSPVQNTDDSGNQIADPKYCNRGNYTNFCSYYVTNSGVQIR